MHFFLIIFKNCKKNVKNLQKNLRPNGFWSYLCKTKKRHHIRNYSVGC
jgi:hypothetical protein